MDSNEYPDRINSPNRRVGVKTDIGLRRQRNEDFLGVDATPNGVLLVVCDGMGGHRGGERASRLAVEVLLRHVHESSETDPSPDPETRLRRAVEQANREILEESKANPELKGMGTTLVAALVEKDHATIINVGDSRAYVVRDGNAQRITTDHSHVSELIAMGELTEEQAYTHPQRNLITRALGVDEQVRPDTFDVPLRQGDRLLLSTDGLHGLVPDNRIAAVIARNVAPDRACDALVEEALARGGTDNVTVAVLLVDAQQASGAITAPVTIQPEPTLPSRPSWYSMLIVAVIIVGGSWLAWRSFNTSLGDGSLGDSAAIVADDSLRLTDSMAFDSMAPQPTPGDLVDPLSPDSVKPGGERRCDTQLRPAPGVGEGSGQSGAADVRRQ